MRVVRETEHLCVDNWWCWMINISAFSSNICFSIFEIFHKKLFKNFVLLKTKNNLALEYLSRFTFQPDLHILFNLPSACTLCPGSWRHSYTLWSLFWSKPDYFSSGKLEISHQLHNHLLTPPCTCAVALACSEHSGAGRFGECKTWKYFSFHGSLGKVISDGLIFLCQSWTTAAL